MSHCLPQNDRKRFSSRSLSASPDSLALSLILSLPCLLSSEVYRPKTAGSIAMLQVICRSSFKYLMPRWQTRVHSYPTGRQKQAGAGWMPHLSEANYRCTYHIYPYQEAINLPWQEDCVSLYTPYRSGGEGAKLVWARIPEGGREKQQGKVKWQKSIVVGRASRREKKQTAKWKQKEPKKHNRLRQMKGEWEEGSVWERRD